MMGIDFKGATSEREGREGRSTPASWRQQLSGGNLKMSAGRRKKRGTERDRKRKGKQIQNEKAK